MNADLLQGIPGMTNATRSFIQMTRAFMRDYAELNRLVAGEESSDRQIAWAVLDAMSDFNGTPPNLGQFSIEDLLNRSQQNLLLRMTTISLIQSVGLLQTRNHINYSNGGINVGVNDKTPLLMNWLQYFQATTEQTKLRVKTAWNIEGILGPSNSGVFSEYWSVNGTMARWLSSVERTLMALLHTYKFRDIAEMNLFLQGAISCNSVVQSAGRTISGIRLEGLALTFATPAGTVTFGAGTAEDGTHLFKDIKTQVEADIPALTVLQLGGRVFFIEATPSTGVSLSSGTAAAPLGISTTASGKVANVNNGSVAPTTPYFVQAYCANDGTHVVILAE